MILSTGFVYFLSDWSPGWSQNSGSAALHERETTHLWARREASKGGQSHADIKASVQTVWTQIQVLASEPAVLLQYLIKLRTKQQDGQDWAIKQILLLTLSKWSVSCSGFCQEVHVANSPFQSPLSKSLSITYKSTNKLIFTTHCTSRSKEGAPKFLGKMTCPSPEVRASGPQSLSFYTLQMLLEALALQEQQGHPLAE